MKSLLESLFQRPTTAGKPRLYLTREWAAKEFAKRLVRVVGRDHMSLDDALAEGLRVFEDFDGLPDDIRRLSLASFGAFVVRPRLIAYVFSRDEGSRHPI